MDLFQETQKSLQKFLEPTRKPKFIYADNSLEIGNECEELSWNHCTSTPHRSEPNGIAERAVRRVKEGTSAVLLQSALDKEWWADSMECYCYLRNIQYLLSDGRTPYDALHALGIWKGDILVADIEELEKMDASEIQAKRLNAKEVLTPMSGDNFLFPIADGTVKVSGGDQRLRTSTLIRDRPERGEEQEVLRGESDSLLQILFKMTQHGMMRKLKMISGLSQEISLIATTWNSESNCTRREKNHFLFR